MTGFGKAQVEAVGLRASVEVRTVNGKYGDVSIHLPRYLSELESRIKDLVLSTISRGRVDVSITLQNEQGSQGAPKLNDSVVDAYIFELHKLDERGIGGEPTLETVAGLPGVFLFGPAECTSTNWFKLS